MTTFCGQKSSNAEYVYKNKDGERICRILISKNGTAQHLVIEGMGLKLISDFDMETTLVSGIKRNIFSEEKRVGYLEYLGNRNLKLVCGETIFEISVSVDSYDFYKDKSHTAVIRRFWRKDASAYEPDELSDFPIEVTENLSDEELLLVFALPVLRFDFSIDEFECIT